MARAATASPSGESIDSRSTHGDEGTDSGSGDGTRGGEAGWTGWVAMAVFDSACGRLIDLPASAVLSCTAVPSVDPAIDDVAVPTKPKGCDDSRPLNPPHGSRLSLLPSKAVRPQPPLMCLTFPP